jgi:GrpB-like predicted nucleotidyltransferase (UPF0157 family)
MLIHEYKESWADDFNQIKKVLEEGLVNLPVSIEHIGSTAVPQLAAKPIIDISIVFDLDVEFGDIKRRLSNIGYYHNGNQGIPDREVFKRDKTADIHNVLDTIAHHLYVCPVDSEELIKYILFREYLIANEDARIAYQDLKYQIAKEAGPGRKAYARLKELMATAFINGVINKGRKQ